MSKRTLKDWFYLEMVSHRAIDDIMQTPKKEVHFFFFSICGIVFNCSWQLIMFDKKQKCCVKCIHLVTDDGLYNRKAFYTVKIVFYSSSTFIFDSRIYYFKGRSEFTCQNYFHCKKELATINYCIYLGITDFINS